MQGGSRLRRIENQNIPCRRAPPSVFRKALEASSVIASAGRTTVTRYLPATGLYAKRRSSSLTCSILMLWPSAPPTQNPESYPQQLATRPAATATLAVLQCFAVNAWAHGQGCGRSPHPGHPTKEVGVGHFLPLYRLFQGGETLSPGQ